MTSSEDTTTDVDDIIETPIDLTVVDKSQLLFYLATRTPLSVDNLAEDCTSGSAGTKSILRDRFRAEINIDMTDTVRLSGDARRAVMRGSKPLISSGQDRLRRGKSHANRDEYTEAADCFAQAVSIFQTIRECYDAVNHDSPKLEKLIATTTDRHDSAASEAAKDSINYYVLHATQHESEGDKHSEKKPSRAAENYQKAANQLSQALDTAEEYNQSMWQDSSKLSLKPIKKKLTAVSKKLDSIGDTSPTTSTERSDDRADSTGEEQTSGEYRRHNLINALQRLAMKLDESPRSNFVDKYGEYPANVYIESFGSWEDALAAANLGPIDEAARERRTYSRTDALDAVVDLSEELGRLPSRTEMNRKGTVSSTTVANRFEDWKTALRLAQTRIGTNTTEQQNEAETQQQSEISESSIETSTENQESIETTEDRGKSHLDNDQSNGDSSTSPQPSTSDSDSDRQAMVEVMRTLYQRLGRVPKTTEVADECEYVPNDFYREFGSWGEALEAAGIDKEQALLKDIRRVAERLGHIPTTTEIDEYGVYSSSYYLSSFESWRAAIEQAGVEQNFSKRSGRSDRAELLDTIKSLHERLGRAPKATELPEDCEYSQHDFYNEFGSWDEALETAGIDREQSMLDEIERVAEKLGRVPSTVDMQKHGAYTSYSSHFGSWSEALERADIELNKHSGSGSNDKHTMLEIVRDLHKQLRRIPKPTELPEESKYSPNDFYNEFGSWDETLEAAGLDKEQALLDDVERVAEKLGRVPQLTDMDGHGTYSRPTYSTYFDSWSEALERSEVTESTTKRLLETIQSLDDRLDRLPKTTDLRDVSGISSQDYIREFGSWDEALEAAGIDKGQYLVDDLRRVAAEVGEKPGTNDVNRLGKYSSGMYYKYFDSWDAALEAAGLTSVETAPDEIKETAKEANVTEKLPPSTQIGEIASHIDSVGPQSISRLEAAGYTTLGDLRNVEVNDMTRLRGVGRTKALEVIRFAKENVSTVDASSDRLSNDRPSADQLSTSTQEQNSNRIQSGALDTSWETIPENERINGQFLLQVTDVEQLNGGRKTAYLSVRDKNGREFDLNIWSKHDIDQDWREGQWYALEDARGKVWEPSHGTTQKRLSSTKDLKVTELGEDFDPNGGSTRGTVETASEPQQSRATTSGHVRESRSDTTVSNRDTAATADQRESSEDGNAETDNDGILDDIMSDFDEV